MSVPGVAMKFIPSIIAAMGAGSPSLFPVFQADFTGTEFPANVSHSRASNATMIGASGNIVFAPHNLCHRSAGNNWQSIFGSGFFTTDYAVMPSGTRSTLVTYNIANPGAGASLSLLSVTVGRPVVLSVTLKVGTNVPWIRIAVYSTANTANQVRCWIDTSDRTYGIVSAGGAASNASTFPVEDLGSGYFRVHLRGLVPWASTSDANVLVSSAIADGNTTRQGNCSFEFGDVCVTLTDTESPQQFTLRHATNGAAYYGPRLCYDPITLLPRGLLLENARTNVNGNAILNGASGVTLAACTAVDYTLAGMLGVQITGSTAGTSQYVFGGSYSSPPVSTVHALSAIAGPSSTGVVQLATSANYPQNAAETYINFNTVAGVIVKTGTAVTSSGVIPLGGGVYRIWFTFSTGVSPASGAAGLVCIVESATATRLPAVSATGHTATVCGIQLEAGTEPTSLIPTFGAVATRAADSVPDIFLGLPAAYSLAVTFSRDVISPISAATSAQIFGVRNADTSESARFRIGQGNPSQQFGETISGNVGSSLISLPSGVQAAEFRAAMRVATNSIQCAVNGALATPDTSAAIPAGDRVFIGNIGGSAILNGYIKSARIYNVGLTDTQLQELTA